ncbi:hypothetical protein Q5752_004928 [Cryptotrichosporon argae]
MPTVPTVPTIDLETLQRRFKRAGGNVIYDFTCASVLTDGAGSAARVEYAILSDTVSDGSRTYRLDKPVRNAIDEGIDMWHLLSGDHSAVPDKITVGFSLWENMAGNPERDIPLQDRLGSGIEWACMRGPDESFSTIRDRGRPTDDAVVTALARSAWAPLPTGSVVSRVTFVNGSGQTLHVVWVNADYVPVNTLWREADTTRANGHFVSVAETDYRTG